MTLIHFAVEAVDVGATIWDLVFWWLLRTFFGGASFLALSGLGGLIAHKTKNPGWTIAGLVVGLAAAFGFEAWGIYQIVIDIVKLVKS